MASSIEEQFLQLLNRLSSADQHALLAFARFLDQNAASGVESASGSLTETETFSQPGQEKEPNLIEPAEDETVVAAIKRLRASYPMLSRRVMLEHVTIFMSQHMMDGRDKEEVIAELERVFEQQYLAWKGAKG